MRIRDEGKQEALFNATVKVVNTIGFAASSVAKIAREAGVSPATLYIYYKNKDDLLVSTYIRIKREFVGSALTETRENMPVRDFMKKVWFNMFAYISKHADYFQYTEQFGQSPYSDLINAEDVEKYFEPIQSIVKKGIEQKILKDVHFDILGAFTVYPILALSNSKMCRDIEMTEENINTAFTMAWDAIKL